MQRYRFAQDRWSAIPANLNRKLARLPSDISLAISPSVRKARCDGDFANFQRRWRGENKVSARYPERYPSPATLTRYVSNIMIILENYQATKTLGLCLSIGGNAPPAGIW